MEPLSGEVWLTTNSVWLLVVIKYITIFSSSRVAIAASLLNPELGEGAFYLQASPTELEFAPDFVKQCSLTEKVGTIGVSYTQSGHIVKVNGRTISLLPSVYERYPAYTNMLKSKPI